MIRSCMHKALEHRMKFPTLPTVVFGSSGVGKSVFALLAAIGLAASGNHRAVLYLRHVADENEPSSALLCQAL